MSKLIVQKVYTQTEGSIQDHQYGIGDIGLVLEILRNKLYKDPILAVVREYVTNARDAHVEAGKANVPIMVHLPSYDSMYFKVQDFGPGLSPERIEKIFCNYASSTKRNSEDQVGYFGIGSKSAFAYSDSFTIVSVVDGKIRTYSSYIDESRRGKISCLHEADTDQPNGTTIIVPIKKYDADRFLDKLRFVTEFWSVRPTVIKDNHEFKIDYQNETTVFSGNGWSLARNSHYDLRGSHAIMGGIPYAIDVHNHFDSHVARNFFSYSGVRIYFNNSDLSLAASRDSLHYDVRTIKAIREKFDSIIEEINDRISEQISQEASYKDALIKFNSAISDIPELAKIINSQKYNSMPLMKNPKISMFGNEARLTWYSKTTLNNGFVDIKTKTVNYRSTSAEADFYHIAASSKNTVLVFNDTGASDIKKYAVKVFNENNKIDHVVILTLSNDQSKINSDKNLWFANEICNLKTSNIKPDKTLRTSNRKQLSDKSNIFVYRFDSNCSRSDRGRTSIEVSSEEKASYFLYDIKNHIPMGTTSCYKFINNIPALESAIGMKIYAIASSRAEKIPSGWIHIDAAISEKFNNMLNEFDVKSFNDYVGIMSAHKQLSNYRWDKIMKFFKPQIKNNNIIGESISRIVEFNNKYNKLCNDSKIESLANYINNYNYFYSDDSDKFSLKYNYDAFYQKLYNQYPLSKFFIDSYDTNDKDIESINNYINMIDNQINTCASAYVSMCA